MRRATCSTPGALADLGCRSSARSTRQNAACVLPEGLRRGSQAAAIVLSGLADGIDTAVHEAALVAGGRTIGVIGTTIDQFEPECSPVLKERLMREHLVLSHRPFGNRGQPSDAAACGRTMALITHATIIVEASEMSHVLQQGWEALRLEGRSSSPIG
jgi:predicted Rossmann fold nucleotide-binding protein DprA/Smf involved in DNA uptake